MVRESVEVGCRFLTRIWKLMETPGYLVFEYDSIGRIVSIPRRHSVAAIIHRRLIKM